MDDTQSLLARILHHPRVRKYVEGRGWCIKTSCKCPKCSTKPDGMIYTGPDLAAESNLHELLALADAMCIKGHRPDLVWIKDRYFCNLPAPSSIAGLYEIHTGHGPTRTLAVLAALGRALNIKEGDDNAS